MAVKSDLDEYLAGVERLRIQQERSSSYQTKPIGTVVTSAPGQTWNTLVGSETCRAVSRQTHASRASTRGLG